MLSSITLWFATSRTGRAIAAAGALALAIGVALLKVFSAGKQAERVTQDRASLENQRARAAIEDELNTLPMSEREERLRQWSKH